MTTWIRRGFAVGLLSAGLLGGAAGVANAATPVSHATVTLASVQSHGGGGYYRHHHNRDCWDRVSDCWDDCWSWCSDDDNWDCDW